MQLYNTRHLFAVILVVEYVVCRYLIFLLSIACVCSRYSSWQPTQIKFFTLTIKWYPYFEFFTRGFESTFYIFLDVLAAGKTF